jgi:hypothetical protein
MVIEIQTSQDFVRHFFTDINGPVPFYAINTTLSVFLQWSTAMVFAICLYFVKDNPEGKRERHFFLSQIVMFTYLGLDDRFVLHERIEPHFGWDGGLLLLVIGAAQVAILMTIGQFGSMPASMKKKIVAAAGLFAVMLSLDMVLPQEMLLRLSIEDLCKTWASFLLLAFAWEICTGKIQRLKNNSAPLGLSGN